MSYTQAVDSSTFIKLIKERGPLSIWEMSVIVETDIFRVEEKFEPIPERSDTKHILTSKNNYKKLIQEAYVLTLPPNFYTEEERIKTNLWVERDLKKLSTLDEKRLFLADFIYEKSVGKKKDYFKKRKLIEES